MKVHVLSCNPQACFAFGFGVFWVFFGGVRGQGEKCFTSA